MHSRIKGLWAFHTFLDKELNHNKKKYGFVNESIDVFHQE